MAKKQKKLPDETTLQIDAVICFFLLLLETILSHTFQMVNGCALLVVMIHFSTRDPSTSTARGCGVHGLAVPGETSWVGTHEWVKPPPTRPRVVEDGLRSFQECPTLHAAVLEEACLCDAGWTGQFCEQKSQPGKLQQVSRWPGVANMAWWQNLWPGVGLLEARMRVVAQLIANNGDSPDHLEETWTRLGDFMGSNLTIPEPSGALALVHLLI